MRKQLKLQIADRKAMRVIQQWSQFAATTLISLMLLSCVASTPNQSELRQQGLLSPGGRFDFYIDPWMSLHHFAYHYVRQQEVGLKLRGRVPLTADDNSSLSASFQADCASLRAAYQPYIAGSLLHDTEIRALATSLRGGPEHLADTKLRDALLECMPAYRAAFWGDHRSAAEQYLQRLISQLEMFEDKMAAALSTTLHARWPVEPIRVDITPYANWAGAYTDDAPPHITIAATDEAINAYAFEMLFHEAAHTGEFAMAIDAAAEAALSASGLSSDGFWHYLQFFVVGKVTSETFNDPQYVMYAKGVGLAKRAHAKPYYAALASTWHLDASLVERVERAMRQLAIKK